MIPNKLFNFINIYKDKLFYKFDGVTFQKEINKEKHYYFLINLPKIDATIAYNHKELNLSSHHVSIYELRNKMNPLLGEYHYTAYFVDKNKTNLKAHIYFNDNDEIAIEPHLTKDCSNRPLDFDAGLKEKLIHLASITAKPLMQKIKVLFAEEIIDLEIKLIDMEKEIAEISIKQKLRWKLKQVCNFLEKLCLFKPDYTEKHKYYLEKLIKTGFKEKFNGTFFACANKDISAKEISDLSLTINA